MYDLFFLTSATRKHLKGLLRPDFSVMCISEKTVIYRGMYYFIDVKSYLRYRHYFKHRSVLLTYAFYRTGEYDKHVLIMTMNFCLDWSNGGWGVFCRGLFDVIKYIRRVCH